MWASGIALPWHPITAFPSSHVGLQRTGEAAGRNLCPCLPQVVADVRPQRHTKPHARATELPVPLRFGDRPLHVACLHPQAAC